MSRIKLDVPVTIALPLQFGVFFGLKLQQSHEKNKKKAFSIFEFFIAYSALMAFSWHCRNLFVSMACGAVADAERAHKFAAPTEPHRKPSA